LPRATRKHLGLVLAERKKEREPRGSDLTLGFCRFLGVSHSKRQGETLRKNEVMGGKI